MKKGSELRICNQHELQKIRVEFSDFVTQITQNFSSRVGLTYSHDIDIIQILS